MRCLVLATALSERGAEIRFLCHALSDDLDREIVARGFSVERLSPYSHAPVRNAHTDLHVSDVSWRDDLVATQRAITGWGDVEWLVVDHYGLDANWESPLCALVDRLMVIDDLANRPHECDLLLDHNCGAEHSHRYDGLVSSACRRLLGPEYALLPAVFHAPSGSRRDRNGVVRHILVSFGGADPSDETTKVLHALQSIGRPDLEVTVAVGGSNPRWEKITEFCADRPNLHCQRSPSNMAELFAAADLAIGGGGVSLLERCAFSLPAIIESLAPNQESGCRTLAASGGALYLGDAAKVTPDHIAIAVQTMLGSPELVHHLSTQAGKVVDRRGVERAVRAMLEKPMMLRPAAPADCDIIWEWRNDQSTRRFARNPSEISLHAHREWFAAVLNDASRYLLVGEDDSGKVGVLRYDITGDIATVSVFVDPHKHGQGLGSRLIGAGDAWIRGRNDSVRKIVAEVHQENIASMRAFARAGYVTEWHGLVHELRRCEQ